MEFYLGYNRDLVSIKSKIDFIAGYSYNDFLTTNYNIVSTTSNGRVVPGTEPKFPIDRPQYTLISFYGRLNYSYNNRYLLTATVRQDGSSRFSEDNRWGLFPSVALAWKMKEESFLKDVSMISDLKLRASYGITGQQDGIGLYDAISYYTLSENSASYQLGNTFYNMYRPNGYYANRQWEQTATTNIGLDFSLFKNRINGSLEVYQNETSKLLNEIDQPAGTNFSNKTVANVGTMVNKGVELILNADVYKKGDWSVNIGFNTTVQKNEITKLTISDDPNFRGNQFGGISGGTGTTLFIHTVGLPRSSFYVYQQVYGADGKPIDGLFEDRNRDGLINTDDLYQYKNPDPRAFFGFTANVTYKKFNAGMVLRANLDNYVYNNVNSTIGTRNAIFGNGYLNNAYGDLLNTGFSGTANGYILSDYYIQNASFLRMDNLSVGYDMGKVFRNSPANLRLNANIQNVFVISKYKGIDPEIFGGVDNNFYPRPRTFTIGANLDF
jgi:iron complex outermembrane receptor protein